MFIKKKVTTGNDFIYQSSIDGDDYNIERFADCANAFMQSGATCISYCHIQERIANPIDNGQTKYVMSPVVGSYYGESQRFFSFNSMVAGEYHCYKIPGANMMIVSLKEVNCISLSTDNKGIQNDAYCDGFLIYSLTDLKVLGGTCISFDM
jgi:hypothetical protein